MKKKLLELLDDPMAPVVLGILIGVAAISIGFLMR